MRPETGTTTRARNSNGTQETPGRMLAPGLQPKPSFFLKPMASTLKLLPLVPLALSGMGAWTLIENKAEIMSKTEEREPPTIETIVARLETVRLNIHSQGVVAPRTEINLVTEVSGKVVRIHPAFSAGGFFKSGEVLLAIDPRDYDYAVTKTQAMVAEACKE